MTPDQRALRDRFASTPDRAVAATLGAGADPDEPPRPGEWSAREVVRHLIAVELAVWQARFDALASETFPIWPWVEPGLWLGPGLDTFADATARFGEVRGASVARLDRLDAPGWERSGRHLTYGVLDVAALLRIALDHDAEHLAQIAGSGRQSPP